MSNDILESVSQGGYGAYDAENRRIREISDELQRLCRLHEAQPRTSQEDRGCFEIEQRAACHTDYDRHLYVCLRLYQRKQRRPILQWNLSRLGCRPSQCSGRYRWRYVRGRCRNKRVMTGMSPDIFQVKTGTRPQCFRILHPERYSYIHTTDPREYHSLQTGVNGTCPSVT